MHEPADKTHIARRTSVATWIIYDIGNTIFFTGVMGLTFPLWVTRVMDGNDATVGFTLAAAMAAIFFIAPILGAVSDQTGKRMRFLIGFSILSVVATGLIGTGPLQLSLALFAIGVVAIHTADVFYNTILEDISTPNNVGTIAGIGIGLGYIGAIFAVAIAILFIDPFGYITVIRIITVLMLFLMLPLLTFGKDQPRNGRIEAASAIDAVCSSLKRLLATAKGIRQEREWGRFLVARFWYMWAVNAASAFAVLYGVDTIGLAERQVQIILLLGIVTGIPSAALWGRMVDKFTPSSVLKVAVMGQLSLMVLAVVIPVFSLPTFLWVMVGVLTGVFLAGLYVAERPLVIAISPQGRTAEYFGLNAMAGRLAAILGPFSWGLIAVTFGLGQVAAVAWLAICITIAAVILAGLHVTRPAEQSVS
ncbi:MFS transporter [Dehalococcoidia bacterium]|nr:MFS transporter [Dehalococcoidia bacterium]